jgi:hypothetical protein
MSASLQALKGRLDKNLFNQEVFQKADMVERCYMVLVAGPKGAYTLTKVEADYLELMEEAYALLREKRIERIAVRLLRARLGKIPTDKRRWSAIQIMRDAQNLFARFENVNRTVQRGMVRENLVKRIEYCENQIEQCEDKLRPQWEKLLQGYWEQLTKLDGVTAGEEQEVLDTSIPDVTFTNDPGDLMDSMAEDAEIVAS